MPSKLGIHGILPGQTVGVVQQLINAGVVMPTVKSVEGIGWLEDVKKISPQTITMGRYMKGKDGHLVESPPLDGDLRKTARRVIDNLLPKWEAHRGYVDYWEITNEMDPAGAEGHARLAELFIHFIDVADQEGYKLALFSYSLGVPEWEEIEAIVKTGIFGKAKAGGHALALHEYAYPMDKWYGEPLPGQPTYPNRGALACRYRWWYEDFLKPRNEVVPLFITEANLGQEMPKVRPEDWMRQIAWYDARLREDPYVVGAHLFTLGSAGGWDHFDFGKMLPLMVEHMIALKDVEDPTWKDVEGGGPPSGDVTGPSDTTEKEEKDTGDLDSKVSGPHRPREPYGRHYLLLPSQADWQWVAAAQHYWEAFKPTIGTSADDAAYGPGLTERAVTVINPQWWPDDIRKFFETHYPGVRYDPVYADTPEKLKAVLNRRVSANKRFG